MVITTNDFLTSTSFKVTLNSKDYPGIACTIQNFTLPSVSIGNGEQKTPRRNIPLPGDKYKFNPLTVTMIIKEDMENYNTIFQWMKDCVEKKDYELKDKTSDLRVSIFSNKNNPLKTFKFVRAFPSELGSIKFNITDNNDSYLTVDSTFQYAYFDLE